MVTNEMAIRIGGAAGDGVESSGAGFCKALARGGLQFLWRDFGRINLELLHHNSRKSESVSLED